MGIKIRTFSGEKRGKTPEFGGYTNEDEYEKKRCLDEIPQSAQGKTIMTTEPKFVPNEAIEITLDNNLFVKDI